MEFYRWLANGSVVALLGILIIGSFGLTTGCTLEGDTYSGTVVTTDCSAADSGGGIQNCGSGHATDDHHSEEIAAE